MPKASETGPKIDKVWNPNMPVEHLREVLPEGSNLLAALTPPGPVIQTGVISGYHVVTGWEPYLFDADEFVLMGDLTSNGDTTVRSIVALNGDLYVFGESTNGSVTSDLTIRWDTETHTWVDLLGQIAPSSVYGTYGAVVFNDDIYFSYFDPATFKIGVYVLDGATDAVTEFTLPLAGNAYRTQVNGGKLIFQGSFENGVDLITYDPTQASGSEFHTYSLPNNASVYGNVIGSAGSYVYLLGSEGTSSNLYSFNANTGAVALVVSDMQAFTSDEQGQELGATYGSVNGDLYLYNETSSGTSQILKADDQTGSVTVIHQASADGLLHNGAFMLIEETSSNLWFSNPTGGTLTRVSGDGVVSTFNTGATAIYGAEDLNGTLYVTAQVGGTSALYSLAGDGTLTFVSDFSAQGLEYVVGTIDDHLVAITDSDGDGTFELWTSSTPSIATSWSQISPDDVSVAGIYVNFINGDYII